MNHADVCKTYSDEALRGIVRDLSASRNWPDRLEAALFELTRRKATLRR